MTQWDGNESSCSCDCGFDIPKGGTLDELHLKTPLAPENGGTGVESIDQLLGALGTLKIQAGYKAALGSTAAGAYKDGSVEFWSPFVAPPVVVIGFETTSTAGTFGCCSVAVTDVTEYGFSFRFFNGDSANRNPKFQWIAAGA